MTEALTEFKEWYFFIPLEKSPFLKDSNVLRALSSLHNSKTIDHIFLSGEYAAVENYCEGRIKAKKVSSARYAVELVLDRASVDSYRRVVCVTEERALDKIREDLTNHDYSVETREF